MATLTEMEQEVADAIRVLTSGAVVGARTLAHRFPTLWSPEERVLIERVEMDCADAVEQLQRLRTRINEALARSERAAEQWARR